MPTLIGNDNIVDVKKATQTLKFSTKISGVDSVIKRLKSLSRKINKVEKEALNKIGEKYTEVAMFNLLNSDHTQRYGDRLASEIYFDVGEHKVSIIAGMSRDYIEQLYYAEFGAGMVSREHPLAQQNNWQYDVKKHGDKGWRYITTSDDKAPVIDKMLFRDYYEQGKPFIIENKRGTLVAWTKYSQPTLFMYNTYKQIQQDNYMVELLSEGVEELKLTYKKKKVRGIKHGN